MTSDIAVVGNEGSKTDCERSVRIPKQLKQMKAFVDGAESSKPITAT